MRTLIPGGLHRARAEYWVTIKHYDFNVVMGYYGTTCQQYLTIQQIILMIFANMSHAAIETLVQKISLPGTLCNRWSQLVDVDKCHIFGLRQLV